MLILPNFTIMYERVTSTTPVCKNQVDMLNVLKRLQCCPEVQYPVVLSSLLYAKSKYVACTHTVLASPCLALHKKISMHWFLSGCLDVCHNLGCFDCCKTQFAPIRCLLSCNQMQLAVDKAEPGAGLGLSQEFAPLILRQQS